MAINNVSRGKRKKQTYIQPLRLPRSSGRWYWGPSRLSGSKKRGISQRIQERPQDSCERYIEKCMDKGKRIVDNQEIIKGYLK